MESEKWDRKVLETVAFDMTDEERINVSNKLVDLYVEHLKYASDAADSRAAQNAELKRQETEIGRLVSTLRVGKVDREVEVGEVFDLKAGIADRFVDLEAAEPTRIGQRQLTGDDRQKNLLLDNLRTFEKPEPLKLVKDTIVAAGQEPDEASFAEAEKKLAEPVDDGLEGFVGKPLPLPEEPTKIFFDDGPSPHEGLHEVKVDLNRMIALEDSKPVDEDVPAFRHETTEPPDEPPPAPKPKRKRRTRAEIAAAATGEPAPSPVEKPGTPPAGAPPAEASKLPPAVMRPPEAAIPGYQDALAKIKAATSAAVDRLDRPPEMNEAFRPPGRPGDVFEGRVSPTAPRAAPEPQEAAQTKKPGLLRRVADALTK